MPLCPACGERGIGWRAKLLANESYPARCAVCGRFSTATAATRWAQLGAATLVSVALRLAGPAYTPRTISLAAIAAAVVVGLFGPMRTTPER